MADAPPAEPARREAEFDFLTLRIKLLEPTPGQQFVMLQMLALTDAGGSVREKVELIMNFGTMLGALFVDEDQRVAVHGALARGTADIEEYVDLARQMSEYWDIGEETANNRSERRTRERQPAKAVRAARR
jgi:hypothetical protein